MIEIIISRDFTDAPGARFKTDGDKSGEEFYESLLKNKFVEAKNSNNKLLIDLDNTWGYASSFISGSFGRLSEEFGSDEVLKIIDLKSEDDPLLTELIINEIKNPKRK